MEQMWMETLPTYIQPQSREEKIYVLSSQNISHLVHTFINVTLNLNEKATISICIGPRSDHSLRISELTHSLTTLLKIE